MQVEVRLIKKQYNLNISCRELFIGVCLIDESNSNSSNLIKIKAGFTQGILTIDETGFSLAEIEVGFKQRILASHVLYLPELIHVRHAPEAMLMMTEGTE